MADSPPSSSPPSPPPKPPPPKPKRKPFGLAPRDPSEPDPWLIRKLICFLVCLITGFAYFVEVVVVGAGMVRGERGGGRGAGIAFLVVFHVLLVMFLWSYLKILLVSPGYANDYFPKSPPPFSRNPAPTAPSPSDPPSIPYPSSSASPPSVPPPQPPSLVPPPSADPRDTGDAPAPGPASALTAAAAPALPLPVTAKAAMEGRELFLSDGDGNGSEKEKETWIPPRRPPQQPQLRYDYSYCYKCGIFKPPRAHHCRRSGACVLEMDHYCPWVGQCVGARNHKHFVTFVFWSTLFTGWLFVSLLAVHRPLFSEERGRSGLWGEAGRGVVIALIAVAGFFTLFTTGLLGTHVKMLLDNQTTLEILLVSDQRARDEAVLARHFKWWDVSGKRRVKRAWDHEWGRLNQEANLWWLGSRRRNWEARMGEKWWGWFAPWVNSPCDGLDYPRNRRFDEEGRWRPRGEWPEDLR